MSKKKEKKQRQGPIEYVECPEGEKIGEELIRLHHDHLLDANVRFLFQSHAQKKGARVILGKARVHSKLQKFLTGFDFVILFAQDMWDTMDEKRKRMLADHELCHCSYWVKKDGTIEWCMADHDIQEFRVILDRYGLEGYEVIELMETPLEE